MTNYLLVDGNNLACRAAFANAGLKIDLIDFERDFNPDDAFDDDKTFPTGAIHGFLRSLASLRTRFPDSYLAVIWDSGYKRRLEISTEAMNRGVIPEPYKSNRRRGEIPQPILDLGRQKPHLMRMLSFTNIPQVIVKDEEADDVMASYAAKYGFSDRVLLYTTDKDFYQLLGENVFILNDSGVLDAAWFAGKYGIAPARWVDVGAFMGDRGDNIFGILGWGEVTAVKYVHEHGAFEAVLKALHAKHDHLRCKFPDLNGDGFEKLRALEHGSGEKSRQKYPGVQEWMPFTGVAMAVEEKRTKLSKTELAALMYEERIRLAHKLKMMKPDLSLPDLPKWDRADVAGFRSACGSFRLKEVDAEAEKICAVQP